MAEGLTGWTQAEAQGESLEAVFNILNEQTRHPVENPVGKVLRKGVIVGLGNHTILVTRDGAERPIDDSAAPIRGSDGETVGVVLIFRNVTEQRQAETVLRRQASLLEQTHDAIFVWQFPGTILYWNKGAEQLYGFRQEEALAHELRNPLAPISNSLQILKMPRLDATTSERTREVMGRQVEHLVRLVDDLLDVSRVMRGKVDLRKEQIEMASVVARAVETAQPLIDGKGHELNVNLPDESLPLEADPVRLAQVAGNLLTNATKYTEANGRIWLTPQREDREAVLRVKDTGIGMPLDMLPKVFDLFVQVDNATTKAQGGLGIGLTVVKNLVEMHGGTVRAHSVGLGKGSKFVVRLPLRTRKQEESSESMDSEPSQQATPPSGHRLLVVDDNRDAADSLATMPSGCANNCLYWRAGSLLPSFGKRRRMTQIEMPMPKC